MDNVRMATQAEIAEIANFDNYRPNATVFAFEKGEEKPDLAIVKLVPTLDLAFTNTTLRRRLTFLMNIETALRATGYPEYYFEVDPSDNVYQETVIKWGAERTSDPQEIRFRKGL